MKEKIDFCYLDERPIQGNAEDQVLFGHSALVSTLHQIVTTCPSPYTIGLFGKWGSGKSSISEMLKARLKDSEIPVAIFDVWKHEGDSLRRSFLKDLHKDLKQSEKYDKGKELDERLDSSVAVTESKSGFNPKKFASHLAVVLVIYLVLLFIGLLIHKHVPSIIFPIYAILTSVVTAFFSWFSGANFFDYISKYFDTKTTEINRERYQDPHEFESEFINILKHVSARRVLIIFDNIDRVSGDKALEIISTIKTFLEPTSVGLSHAGVVFLIPCDDVRIRQQLGDGVYANEYLRKFFNSTVHIPEFYPAELEDFALKKLKETKIAEFNNSELAWLIVLAFRSNPRQIVQFINTLISNYLLFVNRSVGGYFNDKYFFRTRVLQLTKYLLIKEIYQTDLEELITANVYTLDHPAVSNCSDKFREFLRTTSHINIESLEPFVSGKLSENERMIPGVTGLIQLMKNPSTTLKINYQDFNVYHDPNLLNQILRSNIERLNDPASVCQFIGAIFLFTKETTFQLNSMTFQIIGGKFSASLYPYIAKVDCGLIVSEYFNRYTPSKFVTNQILVDWMTIIGNRAGKVAYEMSLPKDHVRRIFLTLCRYRKVLGGDRVGQLVSSGYELFSDDDTVVKTVFSDDDLAELMINRHWIIKALNSARGRLDEELMSVFESLAERIQTDDTLDPGEVTQGMIKWILHELNYDDLSEREEILRRFFRIVSTFLNRRGTVLDRQYQVRLINACIRFSQSSRGVSYLVLPVFFALKGMENLESKVSTQLDEFWNKLHQFKHRQIEFVVELTPTLSLNDPKNFEVLINAIRNRPDILSELKEKIDLPTRIKLLKGLLSSGQIEQFRTQLRLCDYEVGTPSVLISVVDKYLKTPRYSEHKELLLEARKGLESKNL